MTDEFKYAIIQITLETEVIEVNRRLAVSIIVGTILLETILIISFFAWRADWNMRAERLSASHPNGIVRTYKVGNISELLKSTWEGADITLGSDTWVKLLALEPPDKTCIPANEQLLDVNNGVIMVTWEPKKMNPADFVGWIFGGTIILFSLIVVVIALVQLWSFDFAF